MFETPVLSVAEITSEAALALLKIFIFVKICILCRNGELLSAAVSGINKVCAFYIILSHVFHPTNVV